MQIEILKDKEVKQLKNKFKWNEGCTILGYWKNGDSFIFAKSEGFQKGKEKTIFCISRMGLEMFIKNIKNKYKKSELPKDLS